MARSSSSRLKPRTTGGGPANLTGVAYQLLSSFTEPLCQLRVLRQDSDSGLDLSQLTIIIEPPGADAAYEAAGRRTVQEIKTRSSGPWNFAAIASDVLPNLWQAYEDNPEIGAFEFLTDGTFGQDVMGFQAFVAAVSQVAPQDRPAAADLRWFRGHLKRVKKSDYPVSCEGLLDYLADRLGCTEKVRLKEFLGRLKLTPSRSFGEQEQACHSFLLRYGIDREPFSVASEIIGRLLLLGNEGGRAITFSQLAEQLRLTLVDLAAWPHLRRKSSELIFRDLGRNRARYRAERDVRRSDPLLSRILEGLSHSPGDNAVSSPDQSLVSPATLDLRPYVLWGESGIGKTWLLARTASRIAQVAEPNQQPVLVWVHSQQDLRRDIEEVARIFCERLWGCNQTLPLQRLAERVQEHVPAAGKNWLIAFIDGVQCEDYLDQLAELDPPNLGVLLVVALTASTIGERSYPFRLVRAAGFSPHEVHKYLERYAAARNAPPSVVQRLLQTPILCSLYSELKEDDSPWQPEDGYELVERFWRRKIALPRPVTADILADLSLDQLRQAALLPARAQIGSEGWSPEGWSLRELVKAGLTNEELASLERSAVFVRDAASRRYGFRHERLLHWAAAEGALRSFERADLSTEELVGLFLDMFVHSTSAWQAFGHVPADLLWLLLEPELPASCRMCVVEILRVLEEVPGLFHWGAWLSRLGGRVVPAIFLRLETHWQARDRVKARLYSEALEEIAHSSVTERATALLRGTDLEQQRFAVQILAKHGTPSAVDPLSIPHGEDVWRDHKQVIRSRLSEDRPRPFAICILAFYDTDEVPWLEAQLNNPVDFVAPYAREALAVFAPKKAIAPVDPAFDGLGLFPRTWLRLARVRLPDQAMDFLERTILASGDPARAALMWESSLYSPRVIDLLFRDLEIVLGGEEGGSVAHGKNPLRALSALKRCVNLDHLEIFWQREGSTIEAKLGEWLVQLGPGNGETRFYEKEAREVLQKIGGPGMGKAGAALLEERASSPSVERDGINLAVRSPNERAICALKERALGSVWPVDTGDGVPAFLQTEAIFALGYLRQFEGFARGILRLGMKIAVADPYDLLRDCLDGRRESQVILDVAQEGLTQTPPSPGAFLLLGCHGGKEAVALLRAYDPAQLPTRELELAWTIGLDLSGDASPFTLAAFDRGLDIWQDDIGWSSWRALVRRMDHLEVQRILLVDQSFDSKRILLADQRFRADVAEGLWSLPKDLQFLAQFGAYLEHFAVLKSAEVKEFLVEHAWQQMAPSWQVVRFSAIRGLAKMDRQEALSATRACRHEEASHRPEEWPFLVLEVAGGDMDALLDAKFLLRDELAQGISLPRLYAVGEALRHCGYASWLCDWLTDQDARVRSGACYACIAQSFDSQLESVLLENCIHRDQEVREVALDAVEHLWNDREVERLIDRFGTETHAGRRWSLLDAAIALGYPGIRREFRQVSWLVRLQQGGCPGYMLKYAVDAVERRRVALANTLAKNSRRAPPA
jgi:hypothetical protein